MAQIIRETLGARSEASAEFALGIEQTAELIAQLLTRTPGGKLTQSDIGEAIATVGELYASAATLELWKLGRVEFDWDKEESELTLCSPDSDTQTPADGRLILGEK